MGRIEQGGPGAVDCGERVTPVLSADFTPLSVPNSSSVFIEVLMSLHWLAGFPIKFLQ